MFYHLRSAAIVNGDVLGAISSIVDGEIDADWSGDNEPEYWTEEARKLGKPDKQIVEERLANLTDPYEIADSYKEEYCDRYGGYYSIIDYSFAFDGDGKPISIAMLFLGEE